MCPFVWLRCHSHFQVTIRLCAHDWYSSLCNETANDQKRGNEVRRTLMWRLSTQMCMTTRASPNNTQHHQKQGKVCDVWVVCCELVDGSGYCRLLLCCLCVEQWWQLCCDSAIYEVLCLPALSTCLVANMCWFHALLFEGMMEGANAVGRIMCGGSEWTYEQ